MGIDPDTKAISLEFKTVKNTFDIRLDWHSEIKVLRCCSEKCGLKANLKRYTYSKVARLSLRKCRKDIKMDHRSTQ